jgi:DNA-binding transcriptional regulator YhcF (GntR family)
VITLNEASPIPPFEQIRSQIADLVRTGHLADGQRLPTVRQLASDLRVAPGTVARAYTALEQQGLIRTRRSRGTTVIAPSPSPSPDARAAAAAFTGTLRGLGLTLDDALTLLRTTWESPTTPPHTHP